MQSAHSRAAVETGASPRSETTVAQTAHEEAQPRDIALIFPSPLITIDFLSSV